MSTIKYSGIKYQQAGPLDVFREVDGFLHKLIPGPSQKVWNKSPDGFQWGYAGSGPAQLALALLLNATNDQELSLRLFQRFKEDFVAKWGDTWEITQDEILEWIEKNKEG
jgi:hypothetical protein